MKRTFIMFGILLLGSNVFGQELTNNTNIQVQKEDILTSIPPTDMSPVVFTTQEELELKLNDKILNVKALIIENKDNPERLRYYREELWRFENAIVKP